MYIRIRYIASILASRSGCLETFSVASVRTGPDGDVYNFMKKPGQLRLMEFKTLANSEITFCLHDPTAKRKGNQITVFILVHKTVLDVHLEICYYSVHNVNYIREIPRFL